MEPICAPATPPFPSAVAIVRVSGDGLAPLLAPLVELPPPGTAALRGLTWDGYSEKALVLYFRAPRSYTGEDVAEFQLHGSPLLVQRFLERLGALGIRPARPGEFTQRALLNGKKGLLEAEALNDLYAAATDAQLRQAMARAGGLPAWLGDARAEIARLAAMVEASIDYGEDEGVRLDIGPLKESVSRLVGVFHVEQRRAAAAGWLRGGIGIAIVGRPNAGKSTLFNALAREDRAIVTDAPGATRDVLDVTCEWAGLPLRLYDTAGLRDTDDPVEALGVARVAAVLEKADLILHLAPITDAALDPEVTRRLAPYAGKVLLVQNKSDLAENVRSDGDRPGLAEKVLPPGDRTVPAEKVPPPGDRTVPAEKVPPLGNQSGPAEKVLPTGGGPGEAEKNPPQGGGPGEAEKSPPQGDGPGEAEKNPPPGDGPGPDENAPPVGGQSRSAEKVSPPGDRTAPAEKVPPLGNQSGPAEKVPPTGDGPGEAEKNPPQGDWPGLDGNAPPVGGQSRSAEKVPPPGGQSRPGGPARPSPLPPRPSLGQPGPAAGHFGSAGGIRISALAGDLGQLEAALRERFLGGGSPDACLGALATERQRGLLAGALGQLEELARLPEGCPPELAASLLQGALGIVARLTGEDRAGLALDAMFSGFCLGK